MQYHARINTIPIDVILNTENKCIAFTKAPNTGAFVDVLKNLPVATWNDKGVEINGVLYPVKTWIKVEGYVKEYFKYLLQNDFQLNPFFM